MFWRVCCKVGVLFILNSCKYLTKQLCPCHFNSSRPLLPRPFLSLLVKSHMRPMVGHSGTLLGRGKDTTGIPGSFLQWSYFCLCLSLFLPDWALYCSHHSKLPWAPISTNYSSCLYCIYFVSHPHKPLSLDPLSISIALLHFKHLNSREWKLGHSLIPIKKGFSLLCSKKLFAHIHVSYSKPYWLFKCHIILHSLNIVYYLLSPVDFKKHESNLLLMIIYLHDIYNQEKCNMTPKNFSRIVRIFIKYGLSWGFPGGAVVENLPANAGDMGSSPGLGRSHMPRSN